MGRIHGGSVENGRAGASRDAYASWWLSKRCGERETFRACERLADGGGGDVRGTGVEAEGLGGGLVGELGVEELDPLEGVAGLLTEGPDCLLLAAELPGEGGPGDVDRSAEAGDAVGRPGVEVEGEGGGEGAEDPAIEGDRVGEDLVVEVGAEEEPAAVERFTGTPGV